MTKIEKVINSIIDKLENIKIKTNVDKLINWSSNSKYLKIKEMSNDDTGEIGEMLLDDVFRKHKYNVVYEKAKTSLNKDWDIEINDYKIEIKTATIGQNSDTFQHENLFKNKNYDILILIDITGQEVYCTMGFKRNIKWENLHQRTINQNPTEAHKLDLSLTSYRKNIAGVKGKEKINPVCMSKIEYDIDFIKLFEKLIKIEKKPTTD